MNGYITVKQVQRDIFQCYIRGTTRPIMSNYITVLHSFTSSKQAREYIRQNWNILKQYN